MLNLRPILALSFGVLLSLGITACNEDTNQSVKTPPKPLATLSVDGVGPLNAQTAFNLHDIHTAFPGLNVSQRTLFQHNKKYQIIEVIKDTKTLLLINPDAKQERVFSVMVKDNLIANGLGHPLGMPFAEIYAYGQTEECAAGAEDLAGKVLCYAPKTGNILYQFGGVWNGAMGQVPPNDVLAGWKLESAIWKPPLQKH